MKTSMSLLQHLKALKTAIPVPQKQIQMESKLSIFKAIKKVSKKQGIMIQSGMFDNMSFCFPLFDKENDPKKTQLNILIKGVFQQGGKIIEFHDKMRQQFAKFIVVAEKTNLESIFDKLKGLVKYEKIIKYEFIKISLNKFKRQNIEEYILFSNEQNIQRQQTSIQQAKTKLEEQILDEKLIRPKIIKSYKELSKESNNLTYQMKEEDIKQQLKEQQQSQQIKQLKMQQQQEKHHQYLSPQSDTQSYCSLQQLKHENIFQQNQRDKEKEQKQALVNQQKEVKDQSQPNVNFKDKKIQEKKKKEKEIQKYKRNEDFNVKSQQQNKYNVFKKSQQTKTEPIYPQFQWQNKRDKREVWYAPPKNMASHDFKNNNFLCDKLRQIYDIYSHNAYDTRKFTYIRAIALIKSHHKEIKYPEDLKEVKDLSRSVYQKLRQLLETGGIKKIDNFAKKDEIRICQKLQKVWGLGTKKAKQFYDMGIRTVQDLRKRPQLISKNMKIGLKYYEQFSKRMPRQKVAVIFQYLKKIFYKQVLSQKMHYIQVAGSYRREKATCGDIDVLICRHDGSVQQNLIKNFVRQLEEQKFITESLSQSRNFTDRNGSNYMGVFYFEGQHHRIDIKHYPVDQYAFALMYFTGSEIFNRQMRMAAYNKGLLLSDHGLTTRQRNGLNRIYRGGFLPILKTQEQIFKFLDLDYCKPSERQL